MPFADLTNPNIAADFWQIIKLDRGFIVAKLPLEAVSWYNRTLSMVVAWSAGNTAKPRYNVGGCTMSEIIPLKCCSKCKQTFPSTSEFFHNDRRCKDGLNRICKVCNRTHANQYRAEHLELVRSKDRVRRPSKRPLSTEYEKYCSACQQMKPRTGEFFHINARAKDGLCSICKGCNSSKSSLYKVKKRKERLSKEKHPREGMTHCIHGHPLVEENIRMHRGRRECKTCHRERERQRKQSQRTGTPIVRIEGYCLHGHPLIEGNVRKGKHAGTCLTCHRDSSKRRYHKNPEKMVAQATAYAKSHRDQINMRFREYRKQESWQQREKASYLRHREQRRQVKRKRYWGLRLNEHEQGVEYIETLYSDPCCYCGRPMQHIDHIVPVAKDGAEHWTNLTAACQRCNNRKRDKSLLDFLLYRLEFPDN